MEELMKPYIINYLTSCAYGVWDGSLKADSHAKLVSIFISSTGKGDSDTLRKATRELTDNLDEKIGFPLNKAPNYDVLWKLFYMEFVKLCEGCCNG